MQASVGARGARLDLVADATDRHGRDSRRRSAPRSRIPTSPQRDHRLQKTMTILQATQASFTKLTALSLFDYLATESQRRVNHLATNIR